VDSDRESTQVQAAEAGFVPPLLLLLRVNALTLWRRFRSLGDQSRLLTGVILAFIVGYLGVAFVLFYEGLRFILRFPGMGLLLVERLLFLLFAILFVLLLLSNLIVSYSTLFRNRETSYLLTMPVPRQAVFQWKLVESTLVASWAFLFLIAPFIVAYGLTRGAPWHFYLATLTLVALFIVLPAVIGAFLAVNVARFLDRRAFQLIALGLVAMLVLWTAYWLGLKGDSSDDAGGTHIASVLDKMLFKTRFAEFPFLPSFWLASGMLAWQEGAWSAIGFFALMLVSYVAFFGLLAFTQMGGLFYDAASVVQSRGGLLDPWKRRKAMPGGSVEILDHRGFAEHLARLVPGLRSDIRALLVKDLRTFWRDTTQWAQSLMLFGLLGVYIFNLPHFSTQLSHPFWVHLVSYLNLGACALNLATLTTRFVFPQFSLEGKRIWIIGMAPLGMVRVIKAKFWLAASTSLVVTLGLITLSCYMLDLPMVRTVYFAGAIVIMTLTLTGLAVGVGVLYPNFKEDNPSKIVSGFGGTFCLVLSFLYILGSVILLALGAPWSLVTGADKLEALAWLTAFAGLSLALGGLPLWLALRRVQTMEI
jgi:ABC-2 type transport system permease protein